MSVGIYCSILEIGKSSPPLHETTVEKFIIIFPKSEHLENVSTTKPQSTALRKSAGLKKTLPGETACPMVLGNSGAQEGRGPELPIFLGCQEVNPLLWPC